MDRLEFKAAFTAVDDAGAIEGIAWPFGTVDRVGDAIDPAALLALDGKTLPMLFAHDQNQVVGVWDSVSADTEGIKVKGRLLVDTIERAREVLSMVREKAVTGLSIGFMTKKAAPRKGGGRTITELDLLETSIVAIPANPGARITNHKDLSMPEVKTVEELAIEVKAANDNLAEVTKRLEDAETALARPNIIRGASDEPTPERKAFASYLRQGDKAGAEDLKTLQVSSDPQGGYLAPPEMASEFIRNLVQFSPIRSVASVRATASPSVIYPVRTGITNARWKGELQAQEGSEPAFGQSEFSVYEMNTYVDISNQLLADAPGVVEQEVNLALSEDFGQKEAAAFLTGTGSNMPAGLMKDAGIAVGKTAASASAISADELIDLYFSLPVLYRQAGTWGMNTKTIAAIRKLKDTQGQYLYQSPATVGEPASLLGRPIVELLEMDDIASGKDPVIFGDFSGYRIIDRVSLSILVNPYSQAGNGITRYHATRRVGGGVIQAAKFRKLRNA